MFASAKIARGRMKLEGLLAKVQQIEEQAALTLNEYPRGLTVERQRLILGIARQMKAHLEDQLRLGQRRSEPASNETEAQHLYSTGEAQRTG